MMQVIFNADDFGRSSSINRAVLQAHRDGVLTSASLMVTGDAVEEAVALAHGTPTLAVGLHLVLSDGGPASPPAEIPHLLARSGHFPTNPARVWIQYIFSPAARAEMTRELRAQFERFAATGLPLDHVDAHQHLHMHPAVWGAVLPLAGEYGAGGVRLPRDDFWLAMCYDRSHAAIKAVWAVVFGILCRVYARDLDRAGDHAGEHAAPRLAVADRVYGLMQSGHMEEAYVLRVLSPRQDPASAAQVTRSGSTGRISRRQATGGESLSGATRDSSLSWRRDETFGVEPLRMTAESHSDPLVSSLPSTPPGGRRAGTRAIELYFHPSLAPQSEPLGPNPGDLATLLSPALRRAIEAGGLMPAGYATLNRAE
jgi:hopanoid biosynthesis associated protein HpnK